MCFFGALALEVVQNEQGVDQLVNSASEAMRKASA